MRITRRCGGSHVVAGKPSGGSEPAGISIPVGNCQAAVSAVIAVQTSSGEAGRGAPRGASNSRALTWGPSFFWWWGGGGGGKGGGGPPARPPRGALGTGP